MVYTPAAGDSSSPTTSTPGYSSSKDPVIPPTSKNFFTAVLEGLGLPVTGTNLRALYSVEHLEGDNDRYNPLNVIQPEPGSTDYNSVGVQSYASFDTGVAGTVTLLSNDHWDGVRAALKRSQSTADVLSAFQAAYTWDPGVQFPMSASIWSSEAGRDVGANPGTPGAGTTAAGSGSSSSSTGGAQGIDWNPFDWIDGKAESDAVNSMKDWVYKLAFASFGAVLVVLGAYEASKPARESMQQTTEELAPLAAAAL